MKLSEIRKNYVIETRIDIDDSNYVILREPTQDEVVSMNIEDGSAIMQKMTELFPKCLIESSFKTEAGEPASGNELYNELKQTGSLFLEILNTWIESIPFQSRLQKKEK